MQEAPETVEPLLFDFEDGKGPVPAHWHPNGTKTVSFSIWSELFDAGSGSV